MRTQHDPAPLSVVGWTFKDELFERHAGQPIPLRKHMHESYQIAVNTRAPGRYVLDGVAWLAGPGDIVVVHPGEVHSTVGDCGRAAGSPARLLYISPQRLAGVAADALQQRQALPAFTQRVFSDPALAAGLLGLHQLSRGPATELEMDTAMLQAMAALLGRHMAGRSVAPRACSAEPVGVRRARDYLMDHLAEGVGLAALAQVAGLSAFHLCRAFSRCYGLSPHSYQTALRVERAKTDLARGMAPADVAAAAGFYDQSHLARHFRRVVGVTPGQYQARC